jgi:hypothetical protein
VDVILPGAKKAPWVTNALIKVALERLGVAVRGVHMVRPATQAG